VKTKRPTAQIRALRWPKRGNRNLRLLTEFERAAVGILIKNQSEIILSQVLSMPVSTVVDSYSAESQSRFCVLQSSPMIFNHSFYMITLSSPRKCVFHVISPPYKTNTVVFSQHSYLPRPLLQVITDFGNLFHQPDLLQATTCLIAAERALQHLEYNLPKIDKILSVFQIPQSDYGVYAGFDEGLMQAGLGYLEQIHVFIRSEVPDMPSLLSRLGSIFAPFPAILFTETSFYYIPVEATENVARSNELVQVTVSKSIDNGINTRTRPIAICLTHTSASNSTKGIGSGTESNRQNSGNDNEQSDRQEESNEDKLSDSNKNGVGQGLGPEPSGREGNQTSGKANIYWDIVSEICSSQPDEEPRVVSQRLYTKGGLMIKVYVHCYLYLSYFLIIQ